MTKHYGAPSLTGGPTTFINCTDPDDRRNGTNVNIIRRLDAPGDSEMHHGYPAHLFPLYTVVALDGSGWMWDSSPGDLHGAREELVLCPRCDVREVREGAPAISRVDNATAICDRCSSAEAMADYDGGTLTPVTDWPLART